MLKVRTPKISSRKNFIIILCCIGSIGILISSIFILNSLRLRTVVITTQENNIDGLENIKSDILVFLDEKKVQNTLHKANPWAGQITVQKKFPETLVVNIEKEKLQGYIEINSNTYEITSKGVVVNRVEEKNAKLPTIKTEGLIVKKGNTLPKDIQNVFTFLGQEQENSLEVKEASIDLSGSKAMFVLKDETKIIIPLYKIDSSFPASLQTIVERFRIEGKSVSQIDFSFEKPIITFRK